MEILIKRSRYEVTVMNSNADWVKLWNFYAKKWQSVKSDGRILKLTSQENQKLDNRHGLCALAGFYEEILEGAAWTQESSCKCYTLGS